MAVKAGKHRAAPAQRAPGPVTAAFRAASARPPLALWAWPALPVPVLAWAGLHGKLMAYADPAIGFDATLCLAATLLITPFITAVKLPITRLRWWYGIWVFALGAAGLAIHLAYPSGSMAERAAGTAVDWTGTLIVVLLLPMTVTSNKLAMRLMGEEWKRWQRILVWAVWSVVGAHLILLHAWLPVAGYFGATLPGVLLRRSGVRKEIKRWRADGYSSGGWWVFTGVTGTVCAAGLVILAAEEVHVLAQAIAGSHI